MFITYRRRFRLARKVETTEEVDKINLYLRCYESDGTNFMLENLYNERYITSELASRIVDIEWILDGGDGLWGHVYIRANDTISREELRTLEKMAASQDSDGIGIELDGNFIKVEKHGFNRRDDAVTNIANFLVDTMKKSKCTLGDALKLYQNQYDMADMCKALVLVIGEKTLVNANVLKSLRNNRMDILIGNGLLDYKLSTEYGISCQPYYLWMGSKDNKIGIRYWFTVVKYNERQTIVFDVSMKSTEIHEYIEKKLKEHDTPTKKIITDDKNICELINVHGIYKTAMEKSRNIRQFTDTKQVDEVFVKIYGDMAKNAFFV